MDRHEPIACPRCGQPRAPVKDGHAMSDDFVRFHGNELMAKPGVLAALGLRPGQEVTPDEASQIIALNSQGARHER